jgi:hypothetical protein
VARSVSHGTAQLSSLAVQGLVCRPLNGETTISLRTKVIQSMKVHKAVKIFLSIIIRRICKLSVRFPLLRTYNYSQTEDCLSREMPQRCRVDLSQTILFIVIACNFLKVTIMAIVLWRLNQETIVTIGDAIASFLQTPDHTTEDCCLMSSRTIDRVWKVPEVRSSQSFQPKRREPWLGAISARRWGVCLLLYGLLQAVMRKLWLNKLGVSPQ